MPLRESVDLIERQERYKERRKKRAIRMAKQKAIGLALLVISLVVIMTMEASICLFTIPSGIYFLFCRDDIAWKYADRETRREMNRIS